MPNDPTPDDGFVEGTIADRRVIWVPGTTRFYALTGDPVIDARLRKQAAKTEADAVGG